MKWNFIGAIVVVGWAIAPAAIAAEWVKVTENSAQDQFFVDKTSVVRKGDLVSYWEYREFKQPNEAFLEEKLNQPIYGLVLNWAVNCTNKSQRLRQVTAYDQTRKVIQKFNYGDKSSVVQPQSGSSARTTLEYACEVQPTAPSTSGPPASGQPAGQQ